LKARGEDAVWYAKLIKNFSPKEMDRLILEALPRQDADTRITLIKMITPGSRKSAAARLIPFLDPKEPELTIAILKLVCQNRLEVSRGMELEAYLTHTHPVVRGFAGACYFYRNPADHQERIDQWLENGDVKLRQSGVISAGLSNRHSYIDILLALLDRPENAPIIPDIIIALSRLGARELNTVVFSYLSHRDKATQMAALDALEINDEATLKKAIQLMGSPSDTLHEFAREKIKNAEYQNNRLLVESLGIPSTRTRRGLFELLEEQDIKELEVLFFAKESLDKSYGFLAMSQTLSGLPQTPMIKLTIEHLEEKKEVVLENVIRVLAIHDQTGRMQTAWRGIFSPDTRQRANAIELVSDILDRKTFNAMLPLLESPTTEVALNDGKKVAKIPKFEPDGRDAVAQLLESEDWVDVVMALGMVRENPGLAKIPDRITQQETTLNPIILKEAQMTSAKEKTRPEKVQTPDPAEGIQSPEISLGEKILLLREIDIFSGLSAAELAAIAGVTKELAYPEESTVIKQDSLGETVFLIIQGKVAVIMETKDGREEIIDHMEGGNAFGEMALIDNAPRSATIRTVTPCRFLILHKQEFKETAMEFPRIALQICSVLSQRIRHLHARVQNTEG
ncbi:MAG: cyclic nucleotide-binding domain-containing protein, partial [Desulfobacterales bacterium]|nr:cyclic nucleotide-binding domain-containing protein [Desulfobacterales bacterium]